MKLKTYIILFIVFASTLMSSSRVAFSRPNLVYKTPGSYFPDLGEGKVSLGFTSEIIDFGNAQPTSSSSSAFVMSKINKWNVGLSYSLLPDYRSYDAITASEDDEETEGVIEGPLSESPYEIGIHLQRRIYGYKSLYMDIGLQDIMLKSFNEDKGLFNDASFFFVVSNNSQFGNYDLTINYGFGTGKIGSDSHNYDDTGGATMSPFLAMILNTPYFGNKMNFMFEYDGAGINIGTQFPVTDVYSLRLGVTHINAITEWGYRTQDGNNDEPLKGTDPTLTFGFIMNIPDSKSDQERIKKSLLDPEVEKFGEFQPLVIIDSSKIKEQEDIISGYVDSLRTYQLELENMLHENAYLRKDLGVLQDSTKKMLLDIQIDLSKRNEALRLFQNSHDLLVEEKYHDALDVIDKVIELQPNLAIAYARRGTIHYYLNDLKAASMNWNIALKLDPEYYQVRDILQGLKEGRIEPLYKNLDENKEE